MIDVLADLALRIIVGVLALIMVGLFVALAAYAFGHGAVVGGIVSAVLGASFFVLSLHAVTA